MHSKLCTRINPLIVVVNLLTLLKLRVDGYPVPMTFVTDAEAKGALCLDGRTPAYHFSPGNGSGVNSWVINMEGGGWCSTVEECQVRRGNSRGSSMKMKPMSFTGMTGNRQKYNPDFYNWNHVKLRYCDGSSFTEDVESVDPKNKVYYRGARIWLAIVEELLEKGMKNAENAVLSGCSAGGLATILHCDRFRDLLPATAKVKCFADAGYVINVKDLSGANHIRDFYSGVVATHGSAKNLPSSCTSKFAPELCFFPQYVLQHMRTPLFILNSAYDAWQIKNILAPSENVKGWNDCKFGFKKCSADQISALQAYRSEFLSVLPRDNSTGLFITSCHAHCQSGPQLSWFSKNSPVINNNTIATSVGDWFYDRRVVQEIDCPWPCNDSCLDVFQDE